MAVACANHAGFDIVVCAGGDGVVPGFEDALPVARMEGAEPSPSAEVFDGEADVVEEELIGVGDAAVRGAHPDGLGVEIGEDTVTSFAGDESFLVLLACGDVDGETAEMSRNAIVHGSVAAAFEPEDPAVGGAHLKLLGHQLTVFDTALNGGRDDGNVFREDNLFECAVVGYVGEGMSEDGIRPGSVGDFAGSVFDVPGGDEGGVLYRGEEFLLLLEDEIGLTTVGDVAKEEDDAVFEGSALDGEPKIQRVGIEGFELAGDAFVHGPVVVMENVGRLGCGGKLLPEVFADAVHLWDQEALSARRLR